MWRMLQQPKPDDYVLATGVSVSVREFTEKAFNTVGINLKWEGAGESEIGIDSSKENIIVRIDPNYYRPTEVDLLLGDASKAKAKLSWTPVCNLDELVKEMVQEDLNLLN